MSNPSTAGRPPGPRDLRALTARRGEGALSLRVGRWTLRIDGLDGPLEASLRLRWGPFVTAEGAPSQSLRLLDGGPERWLEPSDPGEPYRLEAAIEDGSLLVRSHHFGLAPEQDGAWRMAISRDPAERLDRLVENAVRYLVARAAVESGGLAFHGAAVLENGRAHLLLGPSGSGKTTAVRLLAPAISLGDDFTAAIPDAAAWAVPAVPFDNLERVPSERPAGAFPIGRIWRLFRSAEDRVDRPLPVLAASSLMTCVAMPWAMPDLADRLLENATRLLDRAPYAHLHFRKTSDLKRVLAAGR